MLVVPLDRYLQGCNYTSTGRWLFTKGSVERSIAGDELVIPVMCVCCVLCVVCCAGLDADLLAVIPAFSRHPSLKHLMLGKNFNIKGRYGLRGESAVQMVVKMILMMNVFFFPLPPQGAGWNSAETGSFGARGRLCELDYVTYCVYTHTYTLANPLWCSAQMHAYTCFTDL